MVRVSRKFEIHVFPPDFFRPTRVTGVDLSVSVSVLCSQEGSGGKEEEEMTEMEFEFKSEPVTPSESVSLKE